MFRHIVISSFFTFLVTSSFAQQASDVIGRWYTEENKGIVEIYRCQDAYCGKIVWLKNKSEDGGPIRDTENPEPELRDRKVEGINILTGLQYEGDGEFEDGEIYDPESGKTYSCLMKMESDEKLEVRGFIGFSLVGRSTIWTRVNERGE